MVRRAAQEAKSWPWPTKEFPHVRSAASVPESDPIPAGVAALFPAKDLRTSGSAPLALASHRLLPTRALPSRTNSFDDPRASPRNVSRPNDPVRPSRYDTLSGTSLGSIAL